ncbi:hypothetical protein [Rhizobium sp. FKY42]|uniref:hypothetical protein n=1 Tax=Rhizobium sp. FKY42 TaxID=2562310 RepID=UPI0010C02885|nr:hypothetical protein [Rhizobium sp. FKY42]
MYTVPTRNLIFAAFATAYYAILVYAYAHPAPYRHEEKKHEAIVATINYLMKPRQLRTEFARNELAKYQDNGELFLKDYPKCCSASMYYRGLSPSYFEKFSSISKVSTTLGTYFNMEDYGVFISVDALTFSFEGGADVTANGFIRDYWGPVIKENRPKAPT